MVFYLNFVVYFDLAFYHSMGYIAKAVIVCFVSSDFLNSEKKEPCLVPRPSLMSICTTARNC